jgi:heavy metal sensor kinase
VTGWWRSHTLRVRLTIWYVATMVIVLGVYAFVVLTFINRNASNALEQQLRRDFQWAAATIYQTPTGAFTWNEPEQIADVFGDVAELDQPWVQVWRTDGSRLLFANSEARRLPVPQSQRLAATADGTIVTVPTDTVPIRILSRRGSIVDESSMREVDVVIQVARSEADMRRSLGQLELILALGLPLAVAIAGFAGFALASRALAPVEQMAARAQTITAERLHDRLPVHNPDDEMGRLAVVFNETLGRLEESFEQMRRFTADVSHELRTPLTSIRSVGEVGLRVQRDEEAYRAIIGSMLEEADRLASLVDRLLTLSRAETQQASLSTEAIDLRALAEDVSAHLGVLAEEQRQTLEIDAQGTPHALGDRLVIRQALINLVDNAIKFSGVGGHVHIRVRDEGNSAIAEVSDSGPGVPTDARERIFDRFYRATTNATGTGLGLSIARGAVEANGGRLTLHATGPTGSTFRISLPRAHGGR